MDDPVTFKPTDAVQHRSNKKKLVIIGQVGDDKELPTVVKDMITLSKIPKGFNYDFAPADALEHQPLPNTRQRSDRQ